MQRLTGLDSMFIYGEESGWPLHAAALSFFDPSTSAAGLDLQRVRELFRQRLPVIGPFRHRLVTVPGGLDRPVWVEDDVDVAAHILGVRVPPPGNLRQVAELASELYAPPLDRSRPLWEKWVIEGVEGGLVGLLDRIHHSTIDGIRGLEVMTASYDVDAVAPFQRTDGYVGGVEKAPTPVRLVGQATVRLAATPARVAITSSHLLRAGARIAATVRQGGQAGMALPFSAPRTVFNQAVTRRRALAFTSLPVADLTEVAKREGVTLNDVVLSLVGGAVRRYLAGRDELPRRSLIAAVPVGLPTRPGREGTGGNRLTIMVASLGTDVEDPVLRLQRVASSARAGKAMTRAVGPDTMMELLGLVPPAAIGGSAAAYARLGMVRFHPPIVNAVVSNVRGSPVPLYMAGARLVSSYPIGPVADGLGLNVTVLSNVDELNIGVTVCPDVVEDPWPLAEGLQAAAAELLDLTGMGRPRTSSPAPTAEPPGNRGRRAIPAGRQTAPVWTDT